MDYIDVYSSELTVTYFQDFMPFNQFVVRETSIGAVNA